MRYTLFLLKAVLYTIIFWYTEVSYGQPPKDTLQASTYFQKANDLLIQKKTDSALLYFQKALPLYQEAKAWEKVASCFNKKSEIHWRASESEKSLQYADKALEICNTHLSQYHPETAIAFDNTGKAYERQKHLKKAKIAIEKGLAIKKELYPPVSKEIALSYHNLGTTHLFMDLRHEAIAFFEKSLQINISLFGQNYMRNVASYNNLMILNNSLGNFEKSIDYGHKALVILESQEEKNNAYLGAIYHTTASAYNRMGNLEKAIRLQQRACYVKEKIYKNHPKLALSYTVMGRYLAEQKKFEEAFKYLNKAKEIYEKRLGNKHPDVAEVYFYTGKAYTEQKKYDQALLFLKKSLAIDELYPDQPISIGESHQQLAIVYSEKKNFDVALEHFDKSLSIYKKMYGDQNAKVATILYYITEIILKQHKALAALQKIEESFQANAKEPKTAQDLDVLDANAYLNIPLLMQTIDLKAQCYLQLFEKEHRMEDLQKCVDLYANFQSIYTALRHSFVNYKDKIGFTQITDGIVDRAIHTLYLLYTTTKEEKNLEKLFVAIEKSKSNTLKELLNDVSVKNIGGISPEILEFEKQLKIDHAYIQSNITNAHMEKQKDTAKIKKLKDQLFEINQRQDSLIAIMEKRNPKYFKLKHNKETISVSEMQKKLDTMTTVVSFFSRDSMTYALTLTKNNLNVKKLHLPNLETRIEDFRKDITAKSIKAYKAKAHEFYQAIIAPLKDQFTGDQLIIIPDGSLWHLNFELLLSANVATENPAGFPYLLKKYTISYANSANLFFNPFNTSIKKIQKTNVLLFLFQTVCMIMDLERCVYPH